MDTAEKEGCPFFLPGQRAASLVLQSGQEKACCIRQVVTKQPLISSISFVLLETEERKYITT